LSFRDIAGPVPGCPATELHPCHGDKIDLKRAKYGYNIRGHVGCAEDVAAEVKYDVISSIWRAVLLGPAH
jgi:hypothetical protein